jgi:F-box-like
MGVSQSQGRRVDHTSSLPTELIAEIMNACFPDALDHEERLFFRNLRSVCRVWRSTAYLTPELWDRLSITVDDEFCWSWRQCGRDGGMILRWLDRAGDRPLTFKLLCKLYTPASYPGLAFGAYMMKRSHLSALDAFVLWTDRNWSQLHLPSVEDHDAPSEEVRRIYMYIA